MNLLRNRTIVPIVLCIVLTKSPVYVSEPRIALKDFQYNELKLLVISKGKRGERFACFHGARGKGSGTYSWVNEGSEIGARDSVVRGISEGKVSIEETIAVNGVDWVLAKFDWPVSTDNQSALLRQGCGVPK